MVIQSYVTVQTKTKLEEKTPARVTLEGVYVEVLPVERTHY